MERKSLCSYECDLAKSFDLESRERYIRVCEEIAHEISKIRKAD